MTFYLSSDLLKSSGDVMQGSERKLLNYDICFHLSFNVSLTRLLKAFKVSIIQ
jgi:hypothetical protein